MIYFIRHGQSEANVKGIFAGPDYPSPLTELGRSQADKVARDILAQNITMCHIVASPVDRAKETAVIIAGIIGIPISSIRYDARLAGYDMGSLSGEPKAGVTPLQRISAQGAEKVLDFQARAMDGITQTQELPGNVLVVSHAGVGRIIQATLSGADIFTFYTQGFPNAQLVKLDMGYTKGTI